MSPPSRPRNALVHFLENLLLLNKKTTLFHFCKPFCSALQTQWYLMLNKDIKRAIDGLIEKSPHELKAGLDSLNSKVPAGALDKWTDSSKHRNCLVHLLTIKKQGEALRHAVLSLGLDVNAQRACDGCTPAHLASWLKDAELLALLRELGADLNLQNKYGEQVRWVPIRDLQQLKRGRRLQSLQLFL
eukprot:g1728.t1